MRRAFVIAGGGIACAGLLAPAMSQQQVDAAMPASGLIVFQPSRAQVQVVGWTQDSVRIVARDAGGVRVELEITAGGVQIHERRASTEADLTPSYTLYVPGTAIVRVRLQSGTISLSGIQGGVRAGVVEGSVRGDSLSGDVELSAVTGPVELHRSSGRLIARSVAGSIVISQVAGSVRARTTSGDLTISTREAGPVEAETYSGLISFNGALGHAASSFTTHSGDIQLRLPAAQNAVLIVTSVEGRATVSCGRPTAPQTPAQPVRIGAGGEPLEVITFTGNVRITCERVR